LVDEYLRRHAMSAQDPVVRARHARRPDPPLVVQEAAGLPLDSSFTEQKKILTRCKGLFLCLRWRRRGAPFQPHAD
jgi:hypothetical protein